VKPEGSTKQRLLQAAINLLWQQSYGAISVDEICSRAAVNKGSFYYAFKTKSELAVAAFEAHWNKRRPALDAVFSPQNGPLERLNEYCDLVVRDQLECYEQGGKILGCPFCSVGCELSTQDDAIRGKAQEMSDRTVRYFVGAVRDAVAQGVLPADTDADELGRGLFCYLTGVLVQAKIENNPAALNRLKAGVFRFLGLPSSSSSS
jgi:TetR/AcrR family transcriptional repressor of nem operon